MVNGQVLVWRFSEDLNARVFTLTKLLLRAFAHLSLYVFLSDQAKVGAIGRRWIRLLSLVRADLTCCLLPLGVFNDNLYIVGTQVVLSILLQRYHFL